MAPKCNLTGLPSVQFKGRSITIITAAQSSLDSVAQQLQSNPDCKVRVVGHGASDKRAQQLSWDRTNAVIRYLVEKQGISENRFIFSYGQEGDPNTVDLEGTEEEGPNTVPAPNPQYQQRRR
jgi:outer membrane protein OmpA-like peptidoglycan-associated protein